MELSEDSYPASTKLPSALYQHNNGPMIQAMEPPPLIFEELSMAHIEAEDEDEEAGENTDDYSN